MCCICQSCCPYLTDRRELAGKALTQQYLFRFAHLTKACCSSPHSLCLKMADISVNTVLGMCAKKILNHESWLPCPENNAVL